MFDLVKMLAGLPQMMNEENMEFLSELIRRDQRRRSAPGEARCRPLLHMACEDDVAANADRFFTIRLILGAEGDPYAADFNGNTPLHYLAKSKSSWAESAARLLLNAGAYPKWRPKSRRKE